jgi:geranylgeranyl pyrophosphate synthase
MSVSLFCPVPAPAAATPATAAEDTRHGGAIPSPDLANHFLQRDGKRIRAMLVGESFRLAGGEGEPPAAITEAVERLHAGSLIIDDIEDDSADRRGQPALHREVGVPRALNTGNLMYFQSLEQLSRAPLSQTTRHQILNTTLRTIRRCHEGQAIDLATRVDDMPLDAILPTCERISRLKTGRLAGLSAWLGAICANPSGERLRALTRFGRQVGVCLQMHNDLAELRRFVDGNCRCDDLRHARVTWPWAWALRETTPQGFRRLRRALANAGGKVEPLRWIASSLLAGVEVYGQQQLRAEFDGALAVLDRHVESTESMQQVLRALGF